MNALADDLTLLAGEIARLAREQRSPLARGKPVAWSFSSCESDPGVRCGWVVNSSYQWHAIDLYEDEWLICYLDGDPFGGWWHYAGLIKRGVWDDGVERCVKALVELEARSGPLEATGDPNVIYRDEVLLAGCDDEYLCDKWLERALREA